MYSWKSRQTASVQHRPGFCWAQVAPLWFLAQFTFNTSLHLTSVTSNTILSSTASLFTYGLSWAVIQEPFVAHKLVSIIVCAAGISSSARFRG